MTATGGRQIRSHCSYVFKSSAPPTAIVYLSPFWLCISQLNRVTSKAKFLLPKSLFCAGTSS